MHFLPQAVGEVQYLFFVSMQTIIQRTVTEDLDIFSNGIFNPESHQIVVHNIFPLDTNQ